MHKEDLVRIQSEVRQVRMEENVLDYLVEIIHATRSTPDLAYGASPRGSLDLQRYSQAIAYLEGRDYTLPDDVKQAALATLPHRLIIKKGSRTVSLGARSVVERLIQEVPAPL
jgi:MoxR-like ATPase